MKPIRARLLLALAPLLLPAPPAVAAVPEAAYGALHWRLIGPFRAGWSTCAEGIPGRPGVFYFGAADGGVWKTTDDGRTWSSLFDHQAVASVGALALAPSDPSVIYVGTGQVAPRWDLASGDGVYRSDDGGASWRRAGLADSRHIGRILVDPRDPDTVLVAALGHVFGRNEERGVFRSTDGGATWAKVLYLDADTGAVDLANSTDRPDTVYAALWQVRRYPWQAYFTPADGTGSGIYKSTDGGVTWTKVGDAGLPAGPLGRIGLAVAPHTGGERVYAVVTARAAGGLYRSDDGGATWRRTNDREVASWYFARLTADPRDPDTVWVMGRSLLRSTDGGATLSVFRGSPGGDDYHFLWIDPVAPGRMILATDQGTTVSVDGGATWSSWYNQPTGQFYHLATDDRFPYWIYSGQQDSGTVAAASRSDYGQLSFRDWHPVGGDERDYDLPFPGDPDVVYGSGLGGRLSRWDAETGQVQNVSPWPVSSYGARPTRVRYRYTWITPIAISSVAPHAIYQGAQLLFRSTDGGRSWQEASADLTGAVAGRARTAACAGDVPVARATACGYGVIMTIAPSPTDADVVWVGTDNGRVQVTRDGGAHWRDVTPEGISDWSRISQIDASAVDPATAYAAVDRHRLDDQTPYAYRTHDFGATWQRITSGLPADGWVSVVRQDPAAPGLLYAGTRRGAYVSFDDGGSWQPLQLDLPTSGVNDLTVHDRDLVAATEGRGLWVLDDLTPLRHLARHPGAPAAGAYLVPPAPAVRLRANENKDTPLPIEEPTTPDPPAGAVLDYYLPASLAGPVTLEILDGAGAVIRSFRSDEVPKRPDAEQYFTDEWLEPLVPLPARPGHDRFVWDLRYARPPAIRYDYSIAAVPGVGSPALPQGPFVLPGRYQVRLTAGEATLTQPLEVRLDPRVDTPAADLAALLDLQRRVAAALGRVTDAYRQGGTTPADSPEDRARSARLQAIGGGLATLETDLEAADRAPTASQEKVLEEFLAALENALARPPAGQAPGG